MVKFTDDERIEKIKEVANYIIENKSSTRKAAEYFGISNATVSDWMNYSLKQMDSKKFLSVKEILQKNMPKTIMDENVRKRVLEAADLIKAGFTVEEIAKAKNTTINVINEDLDTRLPRISQELYVDIKQIQSKNSNANLIIGSNLSVEHQKRDENGRFTK